MATIFKYKNQIYQCTSLEKKLKRLKINREEIDILFEGELTQSELEKKYLELTKTKKSLEENLPDIKLFYFINKITGESITSISEDISSIPNSDKYEPTTKDYLEKLWNKNGKI